MTYSGQQAPQQGYGQPQQQKARLSMWKPKPSQNGRVMPVTLKIQIPIAMLHQLLAQPQNSYGQVELSGALWQNDRATSDKSPFRTGTAEIPGDYQNYPQQGYQQGYGQPVMQGHQPTPYAQQPAAPAATSSADGFDEF